MTRRTLVLSLACLAAAASAFLWTARSRADEEAAVSTGPVKALTLTLDGPNAGRIYFELVPEEAGAPSSFKIDASNAAALQVLTAARAAYATVAAIPVSPRVKRKLPSVRVSYKPDFTVTEIEF